MTKDEWLIAMTFLLIGYSLGMAIWRLGFNFTKRNKRDR